MMQSDATLETGVESPLRGGIRPQRKSQRQVRKDERNKVLSTPLSILQHRLSDVNEKLSKINTVDDFTQGLPALPTDLADTTLKAKMEARAMMVAFLKDEKAWYEQAVKDVQDGK